MTLLPPHSLDPAGPLLVSVDLTTARITLGGELDCCSAPRLAELVPALAAGGRLHWCVDAEGLTFCDGDGLTALLDLRAAAARHGAALHLVAASRCLRRLIALVGLSDVLAVEAARPWPRPVTERLHSPAVSRNRPPQPV